ncbi:ArsR/SmtB family transcription factor [Longispora albida]|uniref:ArsR/SmtB family transcription factor n=1 Tax=Longispora albida TaxID=203523 RepID=UPI0005913129|nr:metalloregulator ArsR/SmtB family transcription factor [Longispora albida]
MSLEEVPRLRALAHPLRLQMLSLLTGAAMSATEVADELGITHANASYHLRQLASAGVVDVSDGEVVRGGRVRRYRYDPAKPVASGTGEVSPGEEAFLYAVAGELQRRAAKLAAFGQTTDAELWVTPDVWSEVTQRVHEASLFLHQSAQPPRTPGTVRTNTTIAMFTMLDEGK